MRVEANRKRKEMYQAQKYIARNLRLMRHLRGVSQERIADLLHMSRSAYCSLESGAKLPDFLTICTLAKFYEISLDYLLAFDITGHILSLLQTRPGGIEGLSFIESYLQLSCGAKQRVRDRVFDLSEKEDAFNRFPWNYEEQGETPCE